MTTYELFLADKASPFCSLAVGDSFGLLSSTEKKYAHFVGQAAWAGARIIQAHASPQSHHLYDLIIFLFTGGDGKLADLGALKSKAGVSSEDWEALLQYSAQVMSNLSNYKVCSLLLVDSSCR
jgi:dipeptidyl-peptidase-3